jgi:hypothetical protein
MATFLTDPSTRPTPPTGSGQDFYIARFEFRRLPNIKGALPVVASGIATVPMKAVGDWDMASFYTLTYDEKEAPKIDAFMLNSRDAQERAILLQALEKSVQFLVFKTGELVAVEEMYKLPLHFLMIRAKPLFDEPAIIQIVSDPVLANLQLLYSMISDKAQVAEEPWQEEFLVTRNSFGTWADMVQARIGERITLATGWRTVGNNAAIMPTTSKLLEFTDGRDGVAHKMFEDDDEE